MSETLPLKRFLRLSPLGLCVLSTALVLLAVLAGWSLAGWAMAATAQPDARASSADPVPPTPEATAAMNATMTENAPAGPGITPPAGPVVIDVIHIEGRKNQAPLFRHTSTPTTPCKACHHKWDGAAPVRKCSTAECHDDLTLDHTDQPRSFFRAMHLANGKVETCQSCHLHVLKVKPQMSCVRSVCHPNGIN